MKVHLAVVVQRKQTCGHSYNGRPAGELVGDMPRKLVWAKPPVPWADITSRGN